MAGNMTRRNVIALAALALMAAVCVAGLSAEDAPVKIAFTRIENQGKDPRYDYLEGILTGTLLFDLADDPGIVIVDRSSLDAILKEHELLLSDLASADQAVRVGKILGADYLLKGQYVFLGTEVMVSLSLVEVETAKTLPFTDRGAGENLVHGLAEQVIERLTGRTVALRSPERERSIISLKDEKPGTIALHCALIRAEIYLDDEFVGYTTGDGTVPSVFENIPPGKHTLRVHLSSFGVVKEPEITFSDWQETLDVKPGKRHVVRASIVPFSYALYDIQKLLFESPMVRAEAYRQPFKKDYRLDFTDREGKKVEIAFSVEVIFGTGQADMKAALVYNGKTTPLALSARAGKRQEAKATVEKVDVTIGLEYESSHTDVSFRIFRNDISQDLWMKKD